MVGLIKSANDFGALTEPNSPSMAGFWYPDGDGKFPFGINRSRKITACASIPIRVTLIWESFLASRGFIVVSVDENFLNGGLDPKL